MDRAVRTLRAQPDRQPDLRSLTRCLGGQIDGRALERLLDGARHCFPGLGRPFVHRATVADSGMIALSIPG